MTIFKYRDALTMMSSCRLHCEMHRTTGVVSRAVVQMSCSMTCTALCGKLMRTWRVRTRDNGAAQSHAPVR